MEKTPSSTDSSYIINPFDDPTLSLLDTPFYSPQKASRHVLKLYAQNISD
jgi:hypothetical protein